MVALKAIIDQVYDIVKPDPRVLNNRKAFSPEVCQDSCLIKICLFIDC